jgi:GNAT superfamily N-acetyltransferase
VIYREATAADVPAMVRCRQNDPDAGDADPRMAAYLHGDHHPGQALAPRVAYVAIDGDVAGYIAGHLTRRFGCGGELQYLYVTPACRGTGVASELVRRLAGWFDSHGASKICVNAADESAAAFYRRLGAVDLKPSWLVWNDIQSTR